MLSIKTVEVDYYWAQPFPLVLAKAVSRYEHSTCRFSLHHVNLFISTLGWGRIWDNKTCVSP
jgi:hypothetical protein